MTSSVLHHLPVGEGWQLSLSEHPPVTAPYQIVTVLNGRGRWARGTRERVLEPSVPWWSGGGGDQVWSSDGPVQWLCLAGDACPVPEFSDAFSRLSHQDEPRCCSSVVADARELAAIIIDCPYPCELKNLLAKGKSLMLLSKTLHSLEQDEGTPSYGVRFYESDFEKVREARRVLLERMEDPPGLAGLAREVGLNELKLKAGFRKLWGTTVYGLLRRERLEAARRFLAEGRGNVGEAAYRVGYTNTSHFAQAFQKEFGVAPGSLARSRT